jgi:hypothetical protein
MIHTEDGKIWTQSIRRNPDEESSKNLVQLAIGDQDLSYLMHKHRVDHMPQEARRHGCEHSDLILAFPSQVTSTTEQLKTQKLYAGLPIADYGLKVGLDRLCCFALLLTWT